MAARLRLPPEAQVEIAGKRVRLGHVVEGIITQAEEDHGGMAPIQYQCVAGMPYWYAEPAQPINSNEPEIGRDKT